MSGADDALWRAYALRDAGDLPGALTQIDRAIALDARDPRSWIAKGDVLLQLRHWKQAAESLARGIALRPAYAEADARLALADALARSGKRKEAEAQLRIVAEMEPYYPSGDAPMKEARRRLRAAGRK